MKKIILILCFLTLIVGQYDTQAQVKNDSDLWEMSIEDLLKVKISTVSKSEQLIEDAPGIATVITAAQIENMGARNMEDVLRQVVGMDIIQKSFQPLSYIGIRGIYSTGSNNKIKIMLNGHTFQSVVGDPFFHINTLPLENIQQIEIIRGPGSALYGTNAFLGVINIITKNENEILKISTTGGSFNTIQQTAAAKIKNKKSELSIYSDFYQTEGPSLLIEKDNATRLFGEKYSSAPGYTTENSRYFTIQPAYNRGNFSAQGFFQKLKTECPIGVSLALTDEDEINSSIAFGELLYKIPVSSKLNIDIKASVDYYDYDGLYEAFAEKTATFYSEKYPDSPFPADDGVFLNVKSKLLVSTGEINLLYQPIEGLDFLSGFSYEYYEQYDVKYLANSNSSGRPLTIDGITYQPFQYYGTMRDVSEVANWNKDANRQVAAGFGQFQFDIKKLGKLEGKYINTLIFTVGSRYDHYNDVGSSFSPRAGLVYSPVDRFNIKLLYGNAFRAPFFHELFQANNSVTFGNTDLRPEKTYTWEGQLSYQLSNNLKWSLTYFNNQLYNLILRDSKGLYRNFGKYHTAGLEGEMRAIFSTDRYVFFNMTYQSTKNTTRETISFKDSLYYSQTDLHSGRNPAFIFNVGGNYDIFNWLSVNASLNYTSERLRSEYKAYNNSGQLNVVDQRVPINERTLISASATFKNIISKLPGLKMQITAHNLLGVDHRDPEETVVIPNDIPRAGRSVMIKISYKL